MPSKIQLGDLILIRSLDHIPPWARGQVMTVDQVKPWGVRAVNEAGSYLRAAWDDFERLPLAEEIEPALTPS